ncbi:hypothetical protein [Oceanirhabdus sp. W0125-5]|uniref:hypothetical protein n=1 Tax=Oceanirhabdus sp. W0125-5 TaxID=2999116 RepID=UPI0022F32498|nr:hypothetical protein [Oceanirhabdus sp. W0125-5]WBW96286.1 hypothetical protein OW730_21715 [Oceanirhabdus sp. W0125-5]
MSIIKINELSGLPEKSPSYVENQLAERIKDMQSLPAEVYKMLNECCGEILDVGPGEGISSMALASVFPKAKIIGVEMDKKHLVGAWPKCIDYSNLELYWGALPGTPSNSKVDGDIKIPQVDCESDQFCSILFSWTGMSRADIFEATENWRHLVGETCIFVVPRFWREGSAYLQKDWDVINELSKRIGISTPEWSGYKEIPGFSEIKAYPLSNTIKARGWILWLSGIFDSLDISFWDTLKDRWKEQPNYQLPEISLELEVVVAKKL